MARQIARLQLPVLRAALGDPTFFSSRRHPVRRFVNRIASLASAFEDFDDEDGRAVPEPRCASWCRRSWKATSTRSRSTSTSSPRWRPSSPSRPGARCRSAGRRRRRCWPRRKTQLRLQQRYAQQLDGDLKAVAAPAFLRDFMSQVWSQVLLRAAERAVAGTVPACAAPAPCRARAVHERAAQRRRRRSARRSCPAAQADAGAQRGHGPDRLARGGDRSLLRPAAAGPRRGAEGHGLRTSSTST